MIARGFATSILWLVSCAAALAAGDPGWPRAYTTSSGARLQIYQPQIASWEGQTHLVAYVAVAYQPKEAAAPVLGTVKVEADTTVALAERLVRFATFTITEVRFGSLGQPQMREIAAEINRALPAVDRVMALDRVLAHLDRSQIAAKDVQGVKADPPQVFVSTKPAVHVAFDGEPIWSPIPNGELRYAINTESTVFRLGEKGPVYLLVAGRWFSAPGFNGPWTFATPTLPDAFRKIPADHPVSRVLVSVPGTPQATEAVLLAQIPQTARVDKRSLTPPEVRYQGAPQYASIEQTSLVRIVNTDKDIIKVGDTHYLCFQGVWFVSASAFGPWVVTGKVPTAIYQIPPSSPVHHVTYVTIVDDSPDFVVMAARAGYTGTMIAWGCTVWGTGYYYPPYVGYVGAAPVYYPVGAGTYARGAVAVAPYGAGGVGQAYNPWTNTYAQTRQGAGVYGNWGSSYVQRGDDWARTARASNYVTGDTTRAIRTDDGAAIGRVGPNGAGFVAGGEEGIYAGRDGNVYRRAEGGWQKYDNGSWGATTQPVRPEGAGTLGQLERDRAARAEGAQRVRERGAARPAEARAGGGARRGGRRR